MADLDEAAILEIASTSELAKYRWKGRGMAPPGYTRGMALAYATVLAKLGRRDAGAQEMAKAATHKADKDALSHYAGIFKDLGMDNSKDGTATLRHLFVLLTGLGMRESSGKHCVGRDKSATNVSADTAEAGLFQMSWNMRSCSLEMQKLFEHYSRAKDADGLRDVFAEGVNCSEGDWQCYGTGAGFEYQRLAKRCPLFAVETAAIGLRHRCRHWGPIIRYEAEVHPEADIMFLEVQAVVVPTV